MSCMCFSFLSLLENIFLLKVIQRFHNLFQEFLLYRQLQKFRKSIVYLGRKYKCIACRVSILYCHRFMAFIQNNLCQPATPVKNWRILLKQSFTAHVPLLAQLVYSDQGEKCQSYLITITCAISTHDLSYTVTTTKQSPQILTCYLLLLLKLLTVLLFSCHHLVLQAKYF